MRDGVIAFVLYISEGVLISLIVWQPEATSIRVLAIETDTVLASKCTKPITKA